MPANPKNAVIAALIASTTAAATLASPAQASSFQAWQVVDVPFGDILNVRKFPSSQSQKQAGYPNGTKLSLTGRCQDGLILDDLAGMSHAQQRQAVRFHWCEIWHDPARNEAFTNGWVYMKYMMPTN